MNELTSKELRDELERLRKSYPGFAKVERMLNEAADLIAAIEKANVLASKSTKIDRAKVIGMAVLKVAEDRTRSTP